MSDLAFASVFATSVITSAEPPAAKSAAREIKLDNGIVVLLDAVPESKHVAVEAFYNVGFIDEPKGMTQAAHLLEHLVCNAGTKSYAPGASMAMLEKKGMANAETLPDWTHYDYVVPPTDLELVLRIEAERLTSLKITPEIIRQEAPRCYSEADYVEKVPQGGMLKHAFMAMAQSWRHGLDKALIRGGMEEFKIEDLERFHRATYRPDNLVLVIAGNFDVEKASATVRERLGAVRSPDAKKIDSVDWAKTPKHAIVHWDSKVRAVCIAFPPPEKPFDRTALSLWGAVIQSRLMSDAEIMARADAVSCSNQLWAVGKLPFFLYAAAKPETDVADLERLLVRRMHDIASQPPGQADAAQVNMVAQQVRQFEAAIGWPEIQQSAQQLAQRGLDESRAIGMVLGQGAINRGVAHRLFAETGSPARTKTISAEQLGRIIRQSLKDDRRIVTILMPADGG